MLHKTLEPDLTPADIEALEHQVGRIVLSGDGAILRVNARCLAMFGYAGWDMVGRNRSVLLPVNAGQSEDESESDPIGQAFASGEVVHADIALKRRDGEPFWAEVSCTPVCNKAGTVHEVIVLLHDVTRRKTGAVDHAGQIAAINTSQAVIHFDMDGHVLHANDRFLQATGYALDEIIGRHHRLFVEAEEAQSEDYAHFWRTLREGGHTSGEYRRLRKDGSSVWLRATYNPILDLEGRPSKIVKYAVDVTPEKKQTADFHGQLAAIDKSQCVVTFAPDGTILDANDNFLEAVGYTLEEIEGRHHRLFVEPAHAHSLEYEIFWSDLTEGRHRSGEFRRLGKNGREIWFQAIYSPVLDQDGTPFKIVKYATAVTREKLRQADHQGQIAAIHKSQSVVTFDLDGTILDANDNFLELTGYRLSQVRGRHHEMLVAPEDRESPAYRKFWQELASGRYKSGEFKRVGKDGREIWIQASYNPILDMNGRPFKVVKNAVDITQQKLRQGDYEGQVAAIHRSQAVVSFDLDGTILEANENFLALMKYGLDDIVGRHHSIFIDPEDAAGADYAQFWSALREGQYMSAKFQRVARDGSPVWIQASYNPIYDLNGEPFKIVKIATDISSDVARAADLSRAQREVRHDPATGLPNRLGLRQFMHQVLNRNDSELALFYLDLDHFKPINDTFGHDVGDFVLRTVAARLQSETGEGQLAARIGGDEFVVAATDLARADIEELAERLIHAISQPIAHGNRTLEVGLSIGIAQTPHDTLEEDELFRFADVALYRSKGKQRGTYTFYGEDLGTDTQDERHLAQEMLFAIKSRTFELTRQLRVGSDGKVIIAVEPRWNHPELGRIGPDRFLRVAEQSGLIVPLGDWTLQAGCQMAANWPGARVAIPLYPKQLLASDVPEMLNLALRECGVSPERVELHLERGMARINPDDLQEQLAELRDIGATLVMDNLLMHEDALVTQQGWRVDRVVVDRRLRNLLLRRSSALAPRLDEALAEDSAAAPGHQRVELDAGGNLLTFALLDDAEDNDLTMALSQIRGDHLQLQA